MTREEAIKLLKYNSNVIHKTINGETDPNEVEALDMAIKALDKGSVRARGKWIGSAMWGTLECSSCGADCPKDGDFYNRTKFCPDCGAIMNEGDEE